MKIGYAATQSVNRATRERVNLAAFPANQMDDNCFITPDAGFTAYSTQQRGRALTLRGMVRWLGLERNSKLIVASDKTKVFKNPSAADFRLTEVAATRCPGTGVHEQ